MDRSLELLLLQQPTRAVCSIGSLVVPLAEIYLYMRFVLMVASQAGRAMLIWYLGWVISCLKTPCL